MREFLLPDLGEGLTEAEIVNWLVEPGDVVVIDQPVVEVESAKSVVELPSPFAGVVEHLHGDVGSVVHAGDPLITIGDGAPAVAAEPGIAVPATGEESGAVLIGYGTRAATATARRAPAAGRFGQRSPQTRRSPVISPLVRRLARENGLDAASLHGSGHDSLVLRADVEEAIRAREAGGARPSAPATGAPPASPAPDLSGDVRIPITGLRRAVAERLATSRREIPEATIWMDVDATRFIEARRELQLATGEAFGLTALLARVVVSGLRRFPVLNASVDTTTNEIVQHAAINLGLAAQTPRGLMVPVVHDADSMTTRQLRDAVTRLVGQASDGVFPQNALSGGTFTLNNFGSLGVDGSAAIINHPEVAILGVGRMIERPWVVDGELAVRTVVELSFVFDHRVCDGGVAAGFLTHIARGIEHPIGLLAEL